MTRRRVHAIIGAALMLGALFVAFQVGREIQGLEFERDMQEQLCVQTIDEMPKQIPERLFLNITDEWNRTLTGEPRLVVASSLEEALLVFAFSDRTFPLFEANGSEAADGDHVMRLVIELGRRSELMGIGGRHCSNHVFVPYTSEPKTLTLKLVHELAHFFGLPHEWGDATYMGYSTCLGTYAERFNEWQLGVLDEWKYPGTAYTPHWERATPGNCPTHQVTVYGIPVLYSTLAVVGGSVVVTLGIARWRKGRREH